MRPNDQPRKWLRTLWFLALGGVVVSSLLPDYSPFIQELSRLNLSDKLEHFLAYAVLAFLPTLHERRRTLLALGLVVVALGVLLEFGQNLSVGRYFELGDMAANTFGVCTGFVLGLPLRYSTN